MAAKRKSVAKKIPPVAQASVARPETTVDAATSDALRQSKKFPIVGIGASAGGLEALEKFLSNVPAGCGMAFVIVQHLDPTHKAALAELLQRTTSMPVVQIRDRMRVAPNHVYVIPPNRDLSILHGVLHLLEPSAPRGMRLPIDGFFRCLADDCQDNSIAVILSGMGSDGCLGLRAIKEKAGTVFVQSDAKFDSMPRCAIDAGLADVIAPAELLPGKIITCLNHPACVDQNNLSLALTEQGALEKIIILLRTQTGQDFSPYKKNTLYRRIERRMGLHQIVTIADYVQFLRHNLQELNILYRELLIGVTSFFRDPDAWEQLCTKALPKLFAERPKGAVLRAWVPACSTGEEAYSLAIMFREALEQVKPSPGFSLQIFATDIDTDAIARARRGVYPLNIAADVNEQRLDRFFVKDESAYRIVKDIREMIIFAPQNVVMDPPFTRLDILSCRNLLIYLAPEMQKKLLPLFFYSLTPGGILMLGTSETVGSNSTLFNPLSGKMRLFSRQDTAQPPLPLAIPAAASEIRHDESVEKRGDPGQSERMASLQSLADELMLQHFCPPAVLTNAGGDILYVGGRTGKYLEPATGSANWNIFVMAREGLRYELSEAFHRALHTRKPCTIVGAQVGNNGGTQAVEITVQSLAEPEKLSGMVLVLFADVPASAHAQASAQTRLPSQYKTRLAALERELVCTREQVQTIREEMQTSQEELKSANEEMQSTNEELQSTNEELTTSREEMQSMNEELHTINQELQAKVDELSGANSDLKNLLDSTNIATLFLDKALRIRRFTASAAKIINLIPGDMGRPVTDIASDLLYPALDDDAQEVLRTLVPRELRVATRGGLCFNVRIVPYRTLDNCIDGVVVSCVDITDVINLENQLREAQARLEQGYCRQSSELEQSQKDLRKVRKKE